MRAMHKVERKEVSASWPDAVPAVDRGVKPGSGGDARVISLPRLWLDRGGRFRIRYW